VPKLVEFEYCSVKKLARLDTEEREFEGIAGMLRMEYRCGVHVAIADAKLRARFPWIDEEIRMKLSANCADVRMRSTPLSEEELARFDVNMANIPRDARVFPAFIEGTEEIDSDEYRAIPEGNNYAITRDFITWTAHWDAFD